MKRDAQIKLLLTFIFFAFGALFFSLGIQQYRVKIESEAQVSLPQCQRTDSSGVPSNVPCGSCGIQNGSVDNSGNASVSFGCEIVCNTTGDPSNTQGCSDGTFPASISDSSWFWCSGSGTSACTEGSGDLKANGTMGGPWVISQQGTSQFQASFQISGYSGCGRMQVDVNFTQIAGAVFSLGENCEAPTPPPEEPTNTPTTPQEQPSNTPAPTNTPTTPPDQPTNTPAPSETPTDTPIPTPTDTPVPTDTPTPLPSDTPVPTPTDTPVPTETPVPTATNTVAPTPTDTPIPTSTTIIVATDTPTPIEQLTVEGKPPGITPWLLILAPIGLILLGLLL